MINILSKKRFLVIEAILEKKSFTQYGLKKELKLGMSIINDSVNFLLEKEFIRKEPKKYVLSDAKGLLELIGFFRQMDKAIVFEAKTSLGKKELMKRISQETVFCLETALERYSNYYESGRVCAYASKKGISSLKAMFFAPGNETELLIFEEKPALSKNEIVSSGSAKYTSKARTIIDLFCDNKGPLAEKIKGKEGGK